MKISSANSTASQLIAAGPQPQQDPKLRETFDSFVGETFYGQMLQAMRKTQGKTPYFNGGRAEEAFRGQLDQTLAQQMSKADAGHFSGSMYDLFSLQRS